MTTTEAPPALLDIAFGIGTFNVQNLGPDLTRAQVVACGRLARMHAGWIGMQEVAEVEDDEDLGSQLDADYYHWHPGSECPIFVRKSRWRPTPVDQLPAGFKRTSLRVLSDGVGGLNPRRDLTGATVSFIENPLFTPTVVADTHLVNGVGNTTDYPDTQLVRRQLRAEQWAGLVEQTTAWHRLGLNVCLVGDMNWRAMPVLGPGFVWLVNDGIDKIGWWPAVESNFDLVLVSAERLTNPSDHDYRVANVRAVANDRYPKPIEPPPPPVVIEAPPEPPPPPGPSLTERVETWIAAVEAEQLAAAEQLRTGVLQAWVDGEAAARVDRLREFEALRSIVGELP